MKNQQKVLTNLPIQHQSADEDNLQAYNQDEEHQTAHEDNLQENIHDEPIEVCIRRQFAGIQSVTIVMNRQKSAYEDNLQEHNRDEEHRTAYEDNLQEYNNDEVR